MFRIGVLVSGNGTNLQAIIDARERGQITGAQIVCVVSNKKEAYGLERAKKHSIEAKLIESKSYHSQAEYEKDLIVYLQEKKLDLIVLAGYVKILSKEFIKAFEGKIINIHPSLIPAFSGKGFYGLKVHEAVLKRGVKISGATVHFVTEGADEGPIIIQKAVEVKKEDTPETLQKRVMIDAEWVIYPQAIKMIVEGSMRYVS